jgi:hypothetical protein
VVVCFVRLQGLFVYGRHRPALMISLAAAQTRLPAQHSSPGQQNSAANIVSVSATTAHLMQLGDEWILDEGLEQ